MKPASVTVGAIVLGCTLVAHVAGGEGSAWGAAPTKRCIEAAESGQQLRGSGKLMEARKAFGVCTAPACPAAVRRDCARWIEEVDAAQPSVSVRLEDDAGHEVTEGRVLVDGNVVKPSAGRAVPIDPGAHHFVWIRSDGNVEEELVVREGEHNRTIVLRQPRAATVANPPPADKPPVASSASVVPWIFGGIGIALLGGGTAFWVSGLAQRSDLERSCAAAHACAQSDIDASRTKLIVGDVFVGVGILALAGAAYFFFTQSADEPATRRAAAR